ncbi:MAG: hypothetical protein DHS20C13_03140 [Thermodesulfobacteriota bacterium]|nr:MAG: hypothetical protein DHS20C13_03140 [Thermodesulfobacteriota bacterium]
MRLIISAIAITLIFAGTVAQAQPNSGDALVTALGAGADASAALFSVDPSTGQRTIISDFGNPSQGPTSFAIVGLAQRDTENVLVLEMGAGTDGMGLMLGVNLTDGTRTIISDFGDNTEGFLTSDPSSIAMQDSITALVVTRDGGTNSLGALSSVNVNSGFRNLVSDFGNSTQGPTGFDPFGVAVLNSNTALVIDPEAGTNSRGALFSVDISSGGRTLLSDFGSPSQGPLGSDQRHVAIGNPGTALVTDFGLNAVFSVDTDTGDREIISNFGDNLEGIVLENPQNALVVDESGGTNSSGEIYRVNLSTGNNSVISDFGNSNQGALGAEPFDIIIYVDNFNPDPNNSSGGSSSCAIVGPGAASSYAPLLLFIPAFILIRRLLRRKIFN